MPQISGDASTDMLSATTPPRDRFLPLPRFGDEDPSARRVGVEIEFSGITERDAADIVTATLGGRVAQVQPFRVEIAETALGGMAIELDSKYAKDPDNAVLEAGLDLSRGVIPVEIITDPIPCPDLPQIDQLREALRSAGAMGSRSGWLRGFGVHLNVQVAGEGLLDVTPVTRAFALIEDWLREADPMDGSRRLLPFVDRYPTAFVDKLAAAEGAGRDELFALYLSEPPNRNRGLDLLPLIAALGPEDLVRRAYQGGSVSARPAWHYRLPDCRIDEPDWTLAYEWNRWVLVEQVAADATALTELAALWRARRQDLTAIRGLWWHHVDEVLAKRLDGVYAQ